MGIVNFSSAHNLDTTYLMLPQQELNKYLLSEMRSNYPTLSIITDLVAMGADINARDSDTRKNLQEIIAQHRETGDSFESENGMTPLMRATLCLDTQILTFILTKNPDLEAKTESGSTALMWAAMHHNTEACRILLEHGADIRAQNLEGETPLRIAAKSGSFSVCELLIEQGAEIEAQNIWGGTPLTKAALSGFIDIVVLLLNNGADIYNRTAQGRTALELGAMYASEFPVATTKAIIIHSRLYPLFTDLQLKNAQKLTLARLCALKKACPTLPADIINLIFSLNKDTLRDACASPLMRMHTCYTTSGRTIKRHRLGMLAPQVILSFIKANLGKLEEIVTQLKEDKFAKLTTLLYEVINKIENNENDDSQEDDDSDSFEEEKQIFNSNLISILHPEKLEVNYGKEVSEIIQKDLQDHTSEGSRKRSQ